MCTRKQPGASGIRTPLISIRFQCTTRSPRSPFKDFLSYGAVFVAFSGKAFPTDLTTIRFLSSMIYLMFVMACYRSDRNISLY